MSDYSGNSYTAPSPNVGTLALVLTQSGQDLMPSSGSGTSSIPHYLMAAYDLNGPTGTTRTWEVTSTPDPDATQYSGEFSGASKNFAPGYILRKWVE